MRQILEPKLAWPDATATNTAGSEYVLLPAKCDACWIWPACADRPSWPEWPGLPTSPDQTAVGHYGRSVPHEPIPVDFNVALNESRLLSAQVDRTARKALLWFEVLSLPVQGPAGDGLIAIELAGVTRIAASLREDHLDDDAQALPLPLDQFDAVVRGFGGSAIYGWEFVDPAPGTWQRWKDRLSTDEIFAADPRPTHVIELFQQGATSNRVLEFRLWFNELRVMDRHFHPIGLTEFAAGGRRWWDALFAGDERASGSGIIPTAADGTNPPPPPNWPS